MPVKTYFHRKQATKLKFTKKNRHSATFKTKQSFTDFKTGRYLYQSGN